MCLRGQVLDEELDLRVAPLILDEMEVVEHEDRVVVVRAQRLDDGGQDGSGRDGIAR